MGRYLSFEKTSLTKNQVENLLTVMGQGTDLERIDISDNDLSGVEPSLLAALARVEYVNVSGTQLTKTQMEVLFRAAIGEGSIITDLLVWELDLSCIDHELLRKVDDTLTFDIHKDKLVFDVDEDT